MWSEWEAVSDELLIKVYHKAKSMKAKDLVKVTLAEIRQRRLITNGNG